MAVTAHGYFLVGASGGIGRRATLEMSWPKAVGVRVPSRPPKERQARGALFIYLGYTKKDPEILFCLEMSWNRKDSYPYTSISRNH